MHCAYGQSSGQTSGLKSGESFEKKKKQEEYVFEHFGSKICPFIFLEVLEVLEMSGRLRGKFFTHFRQNPLRVPSYDQKTKKFTTMRNTTIKV